MLSRILTAKQMNIPMLSTQTAYVSPENVIQHTKVFLAFRNMDKMCGLNSAGTFSLSSLYKIFIF